MDEDKLTLIWRATSDDSTDERVVTLSAPTWTVRIGRSSRMPSKALLAARDNLYFDNPVLSRSHAEVTAHPGRQEVFLTDTESMHGTWVNEEKLVRGEQALLADGDILTFGNQVARGSELYDPLQLKLQMLWDIGKPKPALGLLGHPTVKPNTFMVPGCDDGSTDDESDDIPETNTPNSSSDEDEATDLPTPIDHPKTHQKLVTKRSAPISMLVNDEDHEIISPRQPPHTSNDTDDDDEILDDSSRRYRATVQTEPSDDLEAESIYEIELSDAGSASSDEVYVVEDPAAAPANKAQQVALTAAPESPDHESKAAQPPTSPLPSEPKDVSSHPSPQQLPGLSQAEQKKPVVEIPKSTTVDDAYTTFLSHVSEKWSGHNKPESRSEPPKTGVSHLNAWPSWPPAPMETCYPWARQTTDTYSDGPFSLDPQRPDSIVDHTPTHDQVWRALSCSIPHEDTKPCSLSDRAHRPAVENQTPVLSAYRPSVDTETSYSPPPATGSLKCIERNNETTRACSSPSFPVAESPSTDRKRTLKRKADTYHSLTQKSAVSNNSEFLPDAQPQVMFPGSEKLDTQGETLLTPREEIEKIIAESEPPRKRVKTKKPKPSRVARLARYAATAAAGAFVGGVGAVVALASLPPDYFA